MKRTLRSVLCLVPLLAGMPAVTQAMSPAAVQQVIVEEGWQLLDTKDGVSCYWKVDALGTGSGVFLRFVNASDATVTVNWTVQDGGMANNGSVVLAKGQSAEPGKQPTDAKPLAVRVATASPVISFTITK